VHQPSASTRRLAGRRRGDTLKGATPPLLSFERQVIQWLSKINWLAAAAIGVALWLPLKLLRVAHGDPATALAILDASNKTTILTGLSVLLVPTVLLVLWAAACFVAAVAIGRISAAARGMSHVSESEARESFLRLVVVAVPWALLTWLLVVVAAWRSLPFMLLLASVFSFGLARLQRRPPREPQIPKWAARNPVRLAMLVAAAVAGLTFFLADQALKEPLSDAMWLPPALLDGGHASKVYVLNRNGSEVTMLVDSPRYVTSRPTQSTRLRRCTDLTSAAGPSLWDAISGSAPSPLPKCQSTAKPGGG
jgi:hypothetical protein